MIRSGKKDQPHFRSFFRPKMEKNMKQPSQILHNWSFFSSSWSSKGLPNLTATIGGLTISSRGALAGRTGSLHPQMFGRTSNQQAFKSRAKLVSNMSNQKKTRHILPQVPNFTHPKSHKISKVMGQTFTRWAPGWTAVSGPALWHPVAADSCAATWHHGAGRSRRRWGTHPGVNQKIKGRDQRDLKWDDLKVQILDIFRYNNSTVQDFSWRFFPSHSQNLQASLVFGSSENMSGTSTRHPFWWPRISPPGCRNRTCPPPPGTVFVCSDMTFCWLLELWMFHAPWETYLKLLPHHLVPLLT